MSELKDGEESVAVGAEKQPTRVGGFLLAVFVVLVVALGLVLLFLHLHSQTITK